MLMRSDVNLHAHASHAYAHKHTHTHICTRTHTHTHTHKQTHKQGVMTREEFRLKMVEVLQAGGATPAVDATDVWAQLDVEGEGTLQASAVLAGVQRGVMACVPGWASAKSAAMLDMLGEEEVSQEAFLEGMAEVLGLDSPDASN